MNRKKIMDKVRKNNAEMQASMGKIQKILSELTSEYKKLLYDPTSINSIKHKMGLLEKLFDEAVYFKKEELRLSETLKKSDFVLPLIKNGKVNV